VIPVSALPVIEHGEGRTSLWLRRNRLRLACIVALVETGLIVGSVIRWYVAAGVAVAVFLFHFLAGRRSRFMWVRQISSAAAISQTLPLLVPFVALASVVVVLAVLVAAVLVLGYVVFGRR
jgi:hypothetical protein